MSAGPGVLSDALIAAITVEIDDSKESLDDLVASLPEGMKARIGRASPPGFTWIELTAVEERKSAFADLALLTLKTLDGASSRYRSFRIVHGGMWTDLGKSREPALPTNS